MSVNNIENYQQSNGVVIGKGKSQSSGRAQGLAFGEGAREHGTEDWRGEDEMTGRDAEARLST